MLYLKHFCYLFYMLFRENPREKWIILLLRFIYLTLSIYAGIECQDTKQRRKTKKMYKVQLDMASPRQAEAESSRDHSPPTRNDEWKARNLAMASERRAQGEMKQRAKDQSFPWRTIYSRGELRRPKLLRADVVETH